MMKTYVYLIHAGGFLKIGVAKNPEARLKTMQTGNPYKLRIMALIPFESRLQAFGYEKELHGRFKAHHYTGEWFNYGGIQSAFHGELKKINNKYNGFYKKSENEIPKVVFDKVASKCDYKKRKTWRDTAMEDFTKAAKKFNREQNLRSI